LSGITVFIVIAIFVKPGSSRNQSWYLRESFVGLSFAKKSVKAILPKKQPLTILIGRPKPRTKPVKMKRPIDKAKHVGIPNS